MDDVRQISMLTTKQSAGSLHRWDVTPSEARAIQLKLRGQVIQHDDFERISLVGGIDVGFEQAGRITRAAAVTLGFPQLELIEQAVIRTETRFAYVPGLLSFREIPAVLQALRQLKELPDLIVCDGHGYAHPRRFGLACHLGVLTGIPCLGAAKSRLIGTHAEPAQSKGAWVPLIDKNETIGAVLRTRAKVSPLYVSVGHKICLDNAIAVVLACCPRFRLPETTRWAHRLASG